MRQQFLGQSNIAQSEKLKTMAVFISMLKMVQNLLRVSGFSVPNGDNLGITNARSKKIVSGFWLVDMFGWQLLKVWTKKQFKKFY